jgi:hypothetical protein
MKIDHRKIDHKIEKYPLYTFEGQHGEGSGKLNRSLHRRNSAQLQTENFLPKPSDSKILRFE